MLVEVMEPQHVLEAARVFPSPVALNGGFVLQPGPRYLVLRYVEGYSDVQVSVLGYREFGGYLNFYDPARTLPIIGDRLICLVNLAGSAFLQGRESVPRAPVAPAEPPQPLSDTPDPFDLPSAATTAVAGAVAGAAAIAASEAVAGEADPMDDVLADSTDDPAETIEELRDDEGDDFDLGNIEADLAGDDDPFDIPDTDDENDAVADLDDLDSLLGGDDAGDDSLDISLDEADDSDPLADLGFDSDDGDADPVPADDSEPLSQDSIDDLFN